MRLLLLVALAGLCGAWGREAAPRPNVLFVAVDDLRPELGCYGAAHIRSPHMDRLAAQGLRFDRAYCQVAVCNPSRCSVLSGCRPDTTGIFDNQHFLRPSLPEVTTLPQHFKNHGYTCLSLGKVFHHSEREPGDDALSWSEPSWYHGESYRHWFTPEALEWVNRLKKLPPSQRPKLIRAAPFEAAEQPDEVYPDGQTAAKAVETLRRLAAAEQPFFLAVGFVKPHLPFTCPRKYWDLYPAKDVRMPVNAQPPQGVPAPALHNLYELRSYGTVPQEGDLPADLALQLIRGYRACVSFMDAQFGQVLGELERLGLRERTIVVLWGDHGYHLGENGLFTKMTNFECATRSPLIVSVPAQKTAGQACSALVEFVDLYPSLVELCGLPAPAHLEGLSFVPLIGQPDQPWKTGAFSQYRRPGKDGYMGRSLRTERWRYTEWKDARDGLAGVELYDHHTDPGETVNVAGRSGTAEVQQALSRQLRAGWKQSLPPGS